MDSKLNAATWALDRGVSVVICNGSQDNAIKTIVDGRKVGTFFTETTSGTTPVEFLAENGMMSDAKTFIQYKIPRFSEKRIESHAELIGV
jgi:glutamate 5-kinase